MGVASAPAFAGVALGDLRPQPRFGARPSVQDGIAAGTDATPFVNLIDPEIPIAASLPTVGNFDLMPRTFGLPSGEVAVLGLDDFRLWARKSVDGGAVFGSEVAVGGTGVPDTHSYDARLAADGRLYVAMLVVGSGGGIELRATRSDDLGVTWTTPVVVAAEGSDAFSVLDVRLATGPAGRAAMFLRGHDATRAYVTATIDAGATWTSPRRVDSGAPAGSTLVGGDVAVDNLGRIITAYVQNRGAGDDLFHTRSSDDGLTFAAEVELAPFLHEHAANPDLEIANDGNALMTLWDSGGNDRIYVLRSTTGGVSWTTPLNRAFATDNFDNILQPKLVVDPATAVAFLHYANADRVLSLSRSVNSGLNWGAEATMASAVARKEEPGSFGQVAMKRVGAGAWVLAWEDQRSDTYLSIRTDVYARATLDDGVSFAPEVRADAGSAAGSSVSRIGGLTATTAGNVFLVYADGRDESGRSTNVYGNRSALPLAFAADTRVDADGESRQPSSGWDRTVAADGGAHVYVAFRSRAATQFSDVYVAASADSGQTFAAPVRVGDTTPGSVVNLGPVMRAFPDGRVYLVYQSESATNLEIRFNRSTDFGATWQSADVVIAALPRRFIDFDNPQDAQRLEATADGTVYVAWSGDNNVTLRKSADFGATWGAATDVDQSSLFSAYPLLCAAGDDLLLAFGGFDPTQTGFTIYAALSGDRGATWSPRVDVRAAAPVQTLYFWDLGCGPAGAASMVWSEIRTGTTVSQYAARFDGAAWGTPGLVPTAAALLGAKADVEFTSATVALVAYETLDGAVRVSRSTDGGATFPSSLQLDDATPRPDALSSRPLLAVDDSGRAWASFLDASVGGLAHFVARTSTDEGLTWSAVRRVETFEPQGAREVESAWAYTPGKAVAALPGIGLFAWGSQRATQTYDVLFNRWPLAAPDGDGDGEPATTDCDDADPGVRAVPVEVAAVALEKVAGAARVMWTSQDASAGIDTAYDVVTGDLGELRADAGFARASCLQNAQPDSPYDDTRADPAAGSGWYYLLRAKNVCGAATFGSSRGSLDGTPPCP